MIIVLVYIARRINLMPDHVAVYAQSKSFANCAKPTDHVTLLTWYAPLFCDSVH